MNTNRPRRPATRKAAPARQLDGFEAWQAAQGGPVTTNVNGVEVVR